MRLVAAALLLCLPALSSCGFNKATDRPYTQANGINYRQGDVYVLNAVIAAAQADSGTLIASFTNQSDTETQTLESVAGGNGTTLTAGDFTPISIDPMGAVNLADTSGITVTGSFSAGDVVPVSMSFEDGSTVVMDVPVVYACQQYAGLDVSEPSASTATEPTESAVTPSTGGTKVPPTTAPTAITPIAPTDEPSVTPSGEATPTPSDTSEPSVDASPTAYTCGTSGATGGRN